MHANVINVYMSYPLDMTFKVDLGVQISAITS